MSGTTSNGAWGDAIDAVSAAPSYAQGPTTGYLSGNSGTVNTAVSGTTGNSTQQSNTGNSTTSNNSGTNQNTTGVTGTAYTGAWAPYANSVAATGTGLLAGQTGLSTPYALSSVGSSAVGYTDPTAYNSMMGTLAGQAQGYGAADGAYNAAAGGLANSSHYSPQAVGAYTVGTQGFSQAALQPYLDPYTSQVTNATMGLLNQQQGANTAALQASQARSGNFGDRANVALAQNYENNNLVDASTIGSLQSAGYNTALGQFNASASLGLQAQEANQGNSLALQAANQNAGLSANSQNIGALTAAGNLDLSNRQTGLSGVAQASNDASSNYNNTVAGQTALAGIGNTVNNANDANYSAKLATQQAGINTLALGTKSTATSGNTSGITNGGSTTGSSSNTSGSTTGNSTTATEQSQNATTQSAQQGQVQNISPQQIAALKAALGITDSSTGGKSASDPFAGAGSSGGSSGGSGGTGGGTGGSAGAGGTGTGGTSIPSTDQTKDTNGVPAADAGLGQALGLPAGSIVTDTNGLKYYTYTDAQGNTVRDEGAATRALAQGLVDSNGKPTGGSGSSSSTGTGASSTGSGTGTGTSDADLAALVKSILGTGTAGNTSSNNGSSSVNLGFADGGNVMGFAGGGYVAPALPDAITHRSHHKQLIHAPSVHAPIVHAPMAALGAFGGHVGAPVAVPNAYVPMGAFHQAFADGGSTGQGAFSDPDDADADPFAAGGVDDADAAPDTVGDPVDADLSGSDMAIPTASDLGFGPSSGAGAFGAPVGAGAAAVPAAGGMMGLGQPSAIDAMSLYGNPQANALSMQAGQAQLGLASSIGQNAPHVAYRGLEDTLKASTPADLLLGMLGNFTGNQALSGFGKALEGARAGQLGAEQTNAAIQNNAAQREVALVNNLANNARASNTAQMQSGARLAGQQLLANARMGQMLFKQAGVDPNTGLPRYAMDTNPALHAMAVSSGLVPGGSSQGTAPPTAAQILAAQGAGSSDASDPFAGSAASPAPATPATAASKPFVPDGAMSQREPTMRVGDIIKEQPGAAQAAARANLTATQLEAGQNLVTKMTAEGSPLASGGMGDTLMGPIATLVDSQLHNNPMGVQDAKELSHVSDNVVSSSGGGGGTDAERASTGRSMTGNGMGSLPAQQVAMRKAAYDQYRTAAAYKGWKAESDAAPSAAYAPSWNRHLADFTAANPTPDVTDPRMFPFYQQSMDKIARMPAANQGAARSAVQQSFATDALALRAGKLDPLDIENRYGPGSTAAIRDIHSGYADALFPGAKAAAPAAAAPDASSTLAGP